MRDWRKIYKASCCSSL